MNVACRQALGIGKINGAFGLALCSCIQRNESLSDAPPSRECIDTLKAKGCGIFHSNLSQKVTLSFSFLSVLSSPG
jgi:hypothetical protein